MKLSITTPNYNGLPYLPLCCRSVIDQAGGGVEVEHIIQDAESSDGSTDWLQKHAGQLSSGNHHFSFFSEADNGMYDAINRGWDKSAGDILAWLNCDEQYLAGTLHFVADHFEQNPETDLLFGDMLIVHPDGDLVCFRKAHHPRWPYIMSDYLYVFSCTMFVRRHVFDDGFRLNDRFRDVADEYFVTRVLRAGYRACHVRRYLSVYTWTGQNMSTGDNARREALEILKEAPSWVRHAKPILNRLRLVEKLMTGCYFQSSPLEYSIFTKTSQDKRERFSVKKPSWRWPGRKGPYTK